MREKSIENRYAAAKHSLYKRHMMKGADRFDWAEFRRDLAILDAKKRVWLELEAAKKGESVLNEK